MESVYLKTFLEVVQTGSFTRAASNLCVTQSAVSRRIKFMEVQFDCQLLDRSKPDLTPTPQGKVVLEKARQILEIEQSLLSVLSRTNAKKELTFACTPTFGIAHLPKIQRSFVSSQADVVALQFVLLNPEGIMKNLEKGLYELAVVEHCQEYALGGFKTVPLPGDEIVFAASPDLGLSQADIDINLLFRHHLYGRSDGCCSRTLLESNLQRIGRDINEFKRLIAFDDLHIIIAALLNGDGISFISHDLLQPYFETGQLVEFRIPGFIHERHRTLITSDHLPECSNGNIFIDQILAYFKLPTQRSF